MVPPDSHGVSRVPWYSGTGRVSERFRLRGYHPVSRSFPEALASIRGPIRPAPQPRKVLRPSGLGFSRFAHHYSGNRVFFLFLQVLRCFSSPRSPLPTYGFSGRYMGMTPCGFPHSDIAGSSLVRSSPTLFAAYHVLHRLLAPRHPP